MFFFFIVTQELCCFNTSGDVTGCETKVYTKYLIISDLIKYLTVRKNVKYVMYQTATHLCVVILQSSYISVINYVSLQSDM